MTRVQALSIFIAVVALVATPAVAQRRGDTNRVISVHYGVVIGVESVQLESGAAGGAVLGGLVGAMRGRGRSSGSQARSAAAGAAIGGVGTRLLEGSNEAREYKIRLFSGQHIRIITEPTNTRLGDCVSVEQGRQTNIRRVSDVHCEARDAVPTAAHVAEATACDQAKQGLIEATEEEALELAIRRIRILCED